MFQLLSSICIFNIWNRRNDRGKNLIVDLTFEFALKRIRFSTLLEGAKKFVLARQLLRSGTSISANVLEAQNAESKADFIHKMKVAAKELVLPVNNRMLLILSLF